MIFETIPRASFRRFKPCVKNVKVMLVQAHGSRGNKPGIMWLGETHTHTPDIFWRKRFCKGIHSDLHPSFLDVEFSTTIKFTFLSILFASFWFLMYTLDIYIISVSHHARYVLHNHVMTKTIQTHLEKTTISAHKSWVSSSSAPQKKPRFGWQAFILRYRRSIIQESHRAMFEAFPKPKIAHG